MESCGFSVIPRYLEERRFPEDQIDGARVTHVWAQEPELARHIAAAGRIDKIVERYEDMLGHVDAVLLARDDAERHVEFAMPFLQAGIPIYIDKPLALTCADAGSLFAAQRYPGQLFTCSALRYAQEFKLSSSDLSSIGEIRQIQATTPKDWDKYAVHVIEPALLLMGEDRGVVRTHRWREDETTIFLASLTGGRQLLVMALGEIGAPMALRVIGNKGWKDLVFRDTFTAFHRALQHFVDSVLERSPAIQESFVMDVIALIEAGRMP